MKRIAAFLLAGTVIWTVSCRKDDPLPPLPPDPPPGPQPAQTEFNLENPLVTSYLDWLEKLPYRDGDYTYSNIDDFYLTDTDYRKDWPSPATISWEKAAGGGTQRVLLADNPGFEDAVTVSISGSAVKHDIYNLIPGREYWWKVTSTSGEVVGSGSFRTLGRKRFLKVDKVCNVRDLGGIPTADGSKRIKYGILFRGGEMNGHHKDYDGVFCRIGTPGTRAMLQAGIAADLDMRTADEAESITSSPLGSDLDYIRFETVNKYYYDKFWTTDEYIKALQWTIDELRQGKPVYFHCVFGADRTGTFAFIIESLLGVSENQIAIDYELTSFSYGLETPPRRRGPKNELSVYRYRQMAEGMRTSIFTGSTWQEKIYNFCLKGYPYGPSSAAKISAADLDWFIENSLEAIE